MAAVRVVRSHGSRRALCRAVNVIALHSFVEGDVRGQSGRDRMRSVAEREGCDRKSCADNCRAGHGGAWRNRAWRRERRRRSGAGRSGTSGMPAETSDGRGGGKSGAGEDGRVGTRYCRVRQNGVWRRKRPGRSGAGRGATNSRLATYSHQSTTRRPATHSHRATNSRPSPGHVQSLVHDALPVHVSTADRPRRAVRPCTAARPAAPPDHAQLLGHDVPSGPVQPPGHVEMPHFSCVDVADALRSIAHHSRTRPVLSPPPPLPWPSYGSISSAETQA